MNNDRFQALKNVLEWSEKQLGDVDVPQKVQEDIEVVKEWLNEREQRLEDHFNGV